MKRRSLRGQLIANESRQIIVDDGMITRGYKVVEFYIWARSQADGDDPAGYLAKDTGSGTKFSAQDGRQFAWAGMTTTSGTRIHDFSIIDPNHVIVQDLYVTNIASVVANYLIVVEPIEISQDEAVLQLIKERSQNDL